MRNVNDRWKIIRERAGWRTSGSTIYSILVLPFTDFTGLRIFYPIGYIMEILHTRLRDKS